MLEIKNLSFEYQKGVPVLDNLSFAVGEGKIVGLLGKNGAGKTTALKLILGLLQSENGDISLNKHTLKKNPIDYKSKIGFVSDNHELYNNLTGVEYLNFIADMHNISIEQRRKIYEPLVEVFSVETILSQPIKAYSHGTKQKFAIISSLINDPILWVLDEPLTGLDVESAYTLKRLMKERSDAGFSVLFSSHILEVCEKICDDIAFIKNGKVKSVISLNDYSGIPDFSLEKLYMEVMDNDLSEENP